MQQKTVTLVNESGLHARPAAQFVKLANSFKSAIKVIYRGRTVNAKSMIEMMMAAASRGEEVVIQADGPDEVEAVTALERLLTSELKG